MNRTPILPSTPSTAPSTVRVEDLGEGILEKLSSGDGRDYAAHLAECYRPDFTRARAVAVAAERDSLRSDVMVGGPNTASTPLPHPDAPLFGGQPFADWNRTQEIAERHSDTCLLCETDTAARAHFVPGGTLCHDCYVAEGHQAEDRVVALLEAIRNCKN